MRIRTFSVPFLLLVVLFGTFILQPATSLAADDKDVTRVITVERQSMNIKKDGKVTGIAVEVVEALLKRLNSNARIEVVSWDQYYSLITKTPGIAAFSTAMTADRKNVFKWVGPIGRIENGFYAKKGSKIVISNIDDAKKVKKIATVRNDQREQMLAKQGFTNLVSYKSWGDALKKLLDGEVDLMPYSNLGMPKLLKDAGKNISDLENLYTFSTDLLYIIFNRDTRDDIVRQWQMQLDAMKKDGTFNAIYNKWMPGETPPGILQLVTEEYPPITFMKDGKITGMATEVVQEILKRLSIRDNIKLMSWGDAYQMTLINPNVVLFSTTRTEARENLFKWLGPIGSYNDCLYIKRGSGIKIRSLEDAKKLKAIGTVRDWFSETFLKEKGFKNLMSVSYPAQSVKQVMEGRADAGAYTDMTLPAILKEAGYSMDSLEPAYVIKKYEFYVAFSKDTPDEVVGAWQKVFDGMKKDGAFARIINRWIPGGAAPK